MRFATLLLLALLTGCAIDTGPAQVVPVDPLPPAVPSLNLPVELRQRNWVSTEAATRGQGSCVFASMVSHARWLNQFDLADEIRATYSGGEYDTRLRQKLDGLKSKYPGLEYSFTTKADPRFLDWCDAERRGCIMWWKPYHCCTFCGWVVRNGKQYAVMLDNNRPEAFELTEREQFIRLWAGYGGFALCLMYDPATSVPYPSYELR